MSVAMMAFALNTLPMSAMPVAHARRPKIELKSAGVEALQEAGLPARMEVLPGGYVAVEGTLVMGRDRAVADYVFDTLEQAQGGDLTQARRRERLGRGMAYGGLAVEVVGGVIAVAAAPYAAPVALGVGLGLTLGGAGVGLTGCGLWANNRPLEEAVQSYNLWADQNPQAVGLELD